MSRKKRTFISIKILQNGHAIAETKKPVRKRSTITITSKYTGDLALPFYPLPSDIDLFHTGQNSTALILDQAWEGFVTVRGKVQEIDPKNRDMGEIALRTNDYGSICYQDLRVMFKLVEESKTGKHRIIQSTAYRPNPVELICSNSHEARSYAGAMFIAMIGILGAYYLLATAGSYRPSSIEELSPAYSLPFIAEDHLVTAPEALQSKLDREDIISSAIKFYRATTDLIMGREPDSGKNYLQERTLLTWKRKYDEASKNIEKLKNTQYKVDLAAEKRPLQSTVIIPSVVGESFEQKLERLVDKIGLLHQGYHRKLELRRNISQEFLKDEIYDWENYKSDAGQSKMAADFLKKIRVFNDLTNEQQMYDVAEKLGVRASNLGWKNRQNPNIVWLGGHESDVIHIPAGVRFASFLASTEELENDEKMGQIHASVFGVKRKSVIKEPLVGKVDPNLVANALSKNRFQLQLCYELALRRNQGTKGKMDWRWRIDTRGKITDIELQGSTIRDRKMVECIRRKMAVWRFPRPRRGSVEIYHSFHFAPKKG